MVKVLDASAAVLFFEMRPGYEIVRQLFIDASSHRITLLMTAVNWGEVRYTLMYKFGKIEPQKSTHALQSLPVKIIDVNEEITALAGDLKLHYKMGYCDAMAAALAKLHKAECVTSDSGFRVLKDEIKLLWINPKV